MIILPTKRRLESRRDALYRHLHAILHHASVSQVEDIMRKIHNINLKLKIYFNREGQGHEPIEIFEDEDKDSFETEIPVTVSLDEIGEI